MDYVSDWGLSVWGGGFGLPETVALGAVAVIGYVFGRRGRAAHGTEKPGQEAVRAAEIARQLEAVAIALRGDLAIHRAEVERFKQIIDHSVDRDDDEAWGELREEADRVLLPTLRLVTQVAGAYDQIRKQSLALSQFSGGRTDSLTGLCNSRALSELLQIELSSCSATGSHVSVVMVGLDPTRAHQGESREEQQNRLLQAAELLRPQLRDSDVLARYGIDELVVVMPHTRLYGASVFGRRARTTFDEAGLAVCCGLAQATLTDTSASLLGRADSALYSARAKGVGSQFLHNGQSIREDASADLAPPSNHDGFPELEESEELLETVG